MTTRIRDTNICLEVKPVAELGVLLSVIVIKYYWSVNDKKFWVGETCSANRRKRKYVENISGCT